MRTPTTGSRPWRRSVATAALLLAGLSLVACEGPTAVQSPSPVASVAPTPAGTAGTTIGACVAEALAVSGGPWSAAAGSRGAEVTVQNQGDGACTLSAAPQVSVVDSASGPVAATEGGDGPGPVLEPGSSTRFMVLLGNWCDPNVALPLHVVLQASDAGIQIQGLDLGEADLPPCNGPGQPPTLTANPWTTG